MAIEGNNLWFSSGPGLYRVSRDGDVEPARIVKQPVVSTPEITDIRAARELMKKLEELNRIYGTKDTDEYRETTATYHAFLRKAARDFPLLESPGRKGTNQFLELTFNKDGRGYDGFRFKSSMLDPADFGWIFAYERPSSFYQWNLLPMEDVPWVGLTDSYQRNIAYTNAPWSGLKGTFNPILQILHDGQLKQGKEYFIWMDFRDERPARFFIAFDLFPASARHRSRTVLESMFGLSGPPLRRNE
jgi:hypothetical protein